MTDAHKQAILEALKIYLPVASPVKDDEHIRLLEEAVVELEQGLTEPPSEQDLFDDTV